MKYDPATHHRRSIRLRGYDYSQAGAYFITICVQNKRCIFGYVQNQEMILNEYGQVAYREWEKLPDLWPNMELGPFQIMPNHMHGIIIIHDPVGAPLAGALNAPDTPDERAPARDAPTVGQIVGAYKSRVTTECLKIAKSKPTTLGKLWQRNFWEHIIRDLLAFDRISNYIMDNPKNWKADKFYNKD